MHRIATFALSLLLALGAGSALAGQVAFDLSAFDVTLDDNDEGYVDFALRGNTLVVTFDEEMGHVPATMEGTGLPVDDDDRFVNFDRNAAAERLGLPMTVGPSTILMDVEGNGAEILEAVLARMEMLGLTVEPIRDARPIHTFYLLRGDQRWRLSVTPRIGPRGALIHLQSLSTVAR